MANNVMREIGIVTGTWYIDFLRRLPGNDARNPSCYVLSLRRYFPKEEGIMQYSDGRYFPQVLRTKVSIQ